MKKRFRFFAALLIFCMAFLFAGCDLFPQNQVAYLNQIVITATYNDGTKIEINRKEYLTAYNNYGANLMNSNGYTADQAKEATVNALLNRKILLNEAKTNQSVKAEVLAKVQEKTPELMYQTYEALLSNAKDYETQIRKDWNMEMPDFMAEETQSGTVYNAYKKQAEVVFVNNPNYNGKYDNGERFVDKNNNGKYDEGETFVDSNVGEYKIKKLEASKNYRNTYTTLDQVKEAFLAATKNNNTDTFAKEEYRRYLASLKQTQETLKTSYTEDELVANEVKRIFDNLEENEYLTAYQEVVQFNNGYSTITIDQVLNKYESMMSQSKFIYDNNNDTYKTDMLENFKNVNYVANNEYFHVAHILVKFSDEQQAVYDNLKTLSNDGKGGVISSESYKTQKEALYNSIKGSVRNAETGEITNDDQIAIADILTEINTALNSATTNAQKDEAFRKLMYKYNEDDGIMNADYSYIIGTNDSKMVENFTNASRDLHKAGVYGGVSGLVQSEYGIHIIYYMGACENLFEFNDDGSINLSAYYELEENGVVTPTSDILKLYETKLNNLNNKTLFDLVYEGLVKDNYSEFENINLETIKHDKEIKVVVSPKI